RHLEGISEPTRLAPEGSAGASFATEQWTLKLPEELTRALTAQARAHGLTLNTIMQGAWGMLLSRLSGSEEVVFGITVSGRPAEVPGIEGMVGLFINTLPLRLRVRPGERLIKALAALQDEQSRLTAYQYLG